jgi:hypothetical protein
MQVVDLDRALDLAETDLVGAADDGTLLHAAADRRVAEGAVFRLRRGLL